MEEKKLNLLRRLENAIYATDHGHFEGTFTRVEREKLSMFWASIEGSSINWPKHLAEEDRECLVMRYLRANNLNVSKAISSLKRAGDRRAEYHLDDLNIAQIGEGVRRLNFLPLGLNKMGSPTFSLSIVDLDLNNLQMLESVLAWTYLCEYIDRTYPRNMAPITCIMDCQGKALSSLVKPVLRHPLTLIKMDARSLKLTRDVYPRRLDMTFVYCKPHGIIKPIAKIGPFFYKNMISYHNVFDDTYDSFDLLFEDENAIPVRYGGKREWDINRFIDERRQAEAPEHGETPLEDFHMIEPTALHHYPKSEQARFTVKAPESERVVSPGHEAPVSPKA
ncbi:CRAL-TRIO lipid binding domain [Carpediemonas membranifera]|uniref:CRAL-TRIO lipid binding domain n=1 Tax=Carpediemonas membranifera TaxID=201153 RepID=A0A8J6B3H6_9EUKA|nr:CRAL-TRIO lipid binding domain [Carpediemonas membranifera]|eukprot:KAG9392189.1 CRAL-TRIO lipid binding domain [Carpediemonas membranifera]